jgi:RNA-directed DNA polymerase
MQGGCWNAGRPLVNTDELEQAISMAGHRVLEIQAKLHRWAAGDPHRRFDDLFNLAAPRKRLVISPAKPGGTQREVSGSDG